MCIALYKSWPKRIFLGPPKCGGPEPRHTRPILKSIPEPYHFLSNLITFRTSPAHPSHKLHSYKKKRVYFVLKGLTQSQNKVYTFQTKYIYFPFPVVSYWLFPQICRYRLLCIILHPGLYSKAVGGSGCEWFVVRSAMTGGVGFHLCAGHGWLPVSASPFLVSRPSFSFQ